MGPRKKPAKKKTAAKKRPRTTTRKPQTGKRSNRKRDKARKALPPGKRVSKTGSKYTETRRNRSDRDGRKRL